MDKKELPGLEPKNLAAFVADRNLRLKALPAHIQECLRISIKADRSYDRKQLSEAEQLWSALSWDEIRALAVAYQPALEPFLPAIFAIPGYHANHNFSFQYSMHSGHGAHIIRHRVRSMGVLLEKLMFEPVAMATNLGHLSAAGYWDTGDAEILLAATMDTGEAVSNEVLSVLMDSARAIHPTAIPSAAGLHALMRTHHREAREFMAKFLLAAQREEGLRHTIVQFLTQACQPTRQLLLETILEHDLSRFSSVVMALNEQMSLAWDSQSQKPVREAFEMWHQFESTPQALDAALAQPKSPQQLWFALRVAALNRADQIDELAAVAETLCCHADPNIRYIATDFLAAQSVHVNLAAIVEMSGDPEPHVAAHAMNLVPSQIYLALYDKDEREYFQLHQGFERTQARVPDYLRQPLGLEPGQSLPTGDALTRVIQKRGADLAIENFHRFPAKAHVYEDVIWPWLQVECSRQLAANSLNHLLHEDDLAARSPYTAAMETWERSCVAERLGKLKGTLSPEVRSLMMTLLLDASTDVREEALKSAKKHKILPDEAPLLEKALNRKAIELRRALIGLLLTLPAPDALASCRRLLVDKDAQRRSAGLELARRMVEKQLQTDEVRDAVRQYADARAPLSDQEQIQVDEILGDHQGPDQSAETAATTSAKASTAQAQAATPATAKPTLANGLLLYNPAERTRAPLPSRPLFRPDFAAATNIITSLDALILKHKNSAVPANYGDGTVLLGESYGLPDPKTVPGQTPDTSKWPLAEVWLDWWNTRPADCRDDDGMELIRAMLLLNLISEAMSPYRGAPNRSPFACLDTLIFEAEWKPTKLKGSNSWGGARIHTDILHWILVHQNTDYWKQSDQWHFDLLQLCAWGLLENHDKMFVAGKKGREEIDLRRYDVLGYALNYFRPASGRSHLWHASGELKISSKVISCNDLTMASQIWQIMEWIEEPTMIAPAGHAAAGKQIRILGATPSGKTNPSSRKPSAAEDSKLIDTLDQLLDSDDFSTFEADLDKLLVSEAHWSCIPAIEFLAAARQAQIASRSDLFYHIFREALDTSDSYNYGEVLARLTSRRRNPVCDFCPELEDVAGQIRDKILELELRRGEEPTIVSALAVRIGIISGMQALVRVVAALGTTDLKRNSLWGTRQLDRPTVFGHFIKISMPRRVDTPEEFARLVREAKIPERRLIEVAMFSPHWAAYCEHALALPGLDSAVWWIHAHLKDPSWSPGGSLREEWKATISERTSVPADDLADGAVDAQWFADTTASLGHKPWDNILKVAKYATDGGTGHTRATLFASAMLGTITADELTTRINSKRNQDSVRALGLAVLPPDTPEHRATRESEILARYATLTEFLRTSKQFGSQRRESEKKAYQIALDNLARNAGYADPMRLIWALESKSVADLAQGPVTITAGESSITLSVDEMGDPEISFMTKGKAAKSMPAALKSMPEAKALQERKTQLKRQAARMKKSLEDAMVQGDEFTGAELIALMSHPLMAPRLASLVFYVQQAQLFGTPAPGGSELEDSNGRCHSIAADARIRIAHPLDFLREDIWSAWQHRTFSRELVQPFKQVFREVYVPTHAEGEDNGTHSRRYAGHQVNPRQAQALLSSRGWVMAPEEGCRRTFHAERITARMDEAFTFFTAAEVEGITIETVYFTKAGDWRPLKIQDVPPRIFSEVMRDLDLVVSVAHRGDADPEASASTVEMRAALVDETARLLKLDNVRIADRRALIQGTLGEYSVHLASGVSHRLPGGALFIVPVQAGHRGRLFLPFADDDPKSAQILSTILMLARDKDIKDPNLRQQLTD